MRKFLLMSSALVVLSGMAEAACIQTPSCSSLGYSSSSSCSGGVKCPFGNYWNCTGPNNTNKITELTNKITTLETKVNELSKDAATANCKIGDILYSDMSCNTNVIVSKTPIGVIFDITNKLAVGLGESLEYWSYPSYFDIPGLTNITSGTADWQGKENTQIVSEYCGEGCPAFEYVNTYKTDGTKAGDWYLPAAGELYAIYSNKDVIDTTLSKIGGETFGSGEYWSSSESSYRRVWYLNFSSSSGTMSTTYKDTQIHYVRPVLAF